LRSTLYACLLAALYVYEPSHVEVSTHETVRLDRLAYSQADGWTVQRHGDLLQPGTTTVGLEPGVYRFRTTTDAQVRLGQDSSVTVVTPPTTNGDKDVPPMPRPKVVPGYPAERWSEHSYALAAKGFGEPDITPMLSVIHGDAPHR